MRGRLSRCAGQAAAPTQLLEGEGPAAMMLLDHPGMVVSSHQRPLNRHNPWSSKQVACALLLHMAAGMLHLCKKSIQHVLAKGTGQRLSRASDS